MHVLSIPLWYVRIEMLTPQIPPSCLSAYMNEPKIDKENGKT